MSKFIHWAAAAALSCGAFAYAEPIESKVDRAAENTKNAAGDAIDKTKAAGHNAKANWENGRAYTMLGQVTNASLTKGGFDDLIERFVDADRNRLGPWVKDKNNKEKLDVLDGRIDQFRKDWKAKYGHEFKILKDDVVFGNQMFTVAQGEIGKDAQLAGEKLPPAENVTPGNLNKKDAAGNTAADRNLEHGRNVAYVTVAKSFGMPEVKVPLIHELPDMWKIDVPDSINGQQLYENVLKHLTMANELKDTWPADENDGYRVVAHHVLMAVMGVDEKTGDAAGKFGGDTAKPAEK